MTSEFVYRDVKLVWLGHATFRIETKEGIVIYIDPFVLDENPKKADYIFITHGHFDHCNTDAIQKLVKEDTEIYLPEECAKKFGMYKEKLNLIRENEYYKISEFLSLQTIPAYNKNKPFHRRGQGMGLILDINGVRIYHSGDSDFIDEMRTLENIDIALLPVGGTYTMDANEAIEAIKEIRPKVFIPMHYNYLPELRISGEVLEGIKKQLVGISEVIILEPTVKF